MGSSYPKAGCNLGILFPLGLWSAGPALLGIENMAIDVEATRKFYRQLKQCCLTIVELVNLPSENPDESYLPAALAFGIGNDEEYFHKMVDRARNELVVARIRRYVEVFEQPSVGEIRASIDEMYVRPIHELDFDEEQTLSAATRVIQTARKVGSLFDAPSDTRNDIEGNLEFAKLYCERYDALFAEIIGIDPREAFRGSPSPDELIPKLIDDTRQEFRDVLQRLNQPVWSKNSADLKTP